MPHVPKPQRGSTVSQGLFPKERNSAMTAARTFTSAPTANAWRYTASASAAISSSPVTPIAPRARSANSSRSVRKCLPSSCRYATKRSWSAWQNDWRPARSCSMRAVKASSIPAQSNNGWAGAFLTRRLENVPAIQHHGAGFNIRPRSLWRCSRLDRRGRETGVWPKSSAPHRSTEARSLFRRGYRRQTAGSTWDRGKHGDRNPSPPPSFHTVWM